MDQAGASAPPSSPYRDALLQPGGPKTPKSVGAGQPLSHQGTDLSSEATDTGLGASTAARAQEATTVPVYCGIGDLITGPGASHWRHLLVRDHLAPASRLALYRACTAARDLMLVTAEKAKVTLVIDEPADMARLHEVRRGLQLRGKLRTMLVLEASNSNLLTLALEPLEAGTTWLDRILLHITQPEEPMSSSVLPTVARCCPNLRALNLEKVPSELPSPDLFPKLEELCVVDYEREDAVPLIRIAAPYIKQLTDLQLFPRRFGLATYNPTHHLLLLFTPGTIATRLTTLHLPVTLNDALLGLLVECAPALEGLNVARIRLETDTHAQAQVQWRVLSTHELHLSSLTRLPVSPHLQVAFAEALLDPAPPFKPWGWPTVFCDIMGGEAGAAAGLRPVWMASHLFIQPALHVRVEDQPAALHVALEVMQAWRLQLCEGFPPIKLVDWTMSSQLLLELPRLPPFDDLVLDGLVWLPGRRLYSTLLQTVPDSFHTVYIQADGLTKKQLQQLCIGAPVGRTPELHIKVYGVPDQVQGLQHKLQKGVIVTNWT